MNKISDLLIPQISNLPSQEASKTQNRLTKGEESDFQKLLKAGNAEKPLSISGHAAKRLEERNIQFDGNEYLKVQEALGKLRQKGGHDSLVITGKAAYVLDVDKGMIVTAVDRDKMNENVFTKIDSTIFMN